MGTPAEVPVPRKRRSTWFIAWIVGPAVPDNEVKCPAEAAPTQRLQTGWKIRLAKYLAMGSSRCKFDYDRESKECGQLSRKEHGQDISRHRDIALHQLNNTRTKSGGAAD